MYVVDALIVLFLVDLMSLVCVADDRQQSFNLPFLGNLDNVANAVRKPFLDQLTHSSQIAVKSIMDSTAREQSTTEKKPTTTTEKLVSAIDMGPSGVTTIVKGVLQNSLNMVPAGPLALGDTAVGLLNATDTTAKLMDQLSLLTPGPEKERVYYNNIQSDEESWRKPKYFSTACSFRMACEFGRLLLKPNTPLPVNLVLERSKLIHDLHNRFTRAATYGLLNGECSKYYCVALEFFGTPAQIAGAIVELTNRFTNPDLYE